MPTFTAIALETLLEPRSRDSYKNSSTLKQQTTKSLQNASRNEEEDKSKPKPPLKLNHVYISPALYTTPEPTPILDSSSGSLSPSPYVFNRKGRGGKAFNRRIDGFEIEQQINSNSLGHDIDGLENGGKLQVEEEELVDDNFFLGGENENGSELVDEDFLDPRCDSFDVSSSMDLNDFGRQVENFSVVSNQGDFFDAEEVFSVDGSISNVPSCGHNMESELRATRLSLLEEIERRKAAENALGMMYDQWVGVGDLLRSQTGLTLPAISNASTVMQLDVNWLEQLEQEVIVARFVAEAIGKGEARAEAELVAMVIIEAKDQEISRLRDRLQYYEAVNREMSQRNLESAEVARRQRDRRRGQRKWLWGCIGMSIAIGASVIAYSYLPQTSEHPFASDTSDASCE